MAVASDDHLPALLLQNLDLFACPACGGSVDAVEGSESIRCAGCSRSFPSDAGIPLLFWSNDFDDRTDVTVAMKAFYEETPFPNYDDLDSKASLRQKAEKGVFARLLDEQIPHGARVLEAGCGTGQLSNFLGMTWGRTVFASDMCLNSLKMGHGFKNGNEIDQVAFLQMNLFQPVFKQAVFDLVVCNGVLHHTSDPLLGFRSLLKLVKPHGHIVIGLYHRYGRIPTDLRRFLFRISGDRFKSLDYRLRDANLSDVRKHTWFMDQYKNPHESKHTIEEVLGWFDRSGVDFVNSIPKPSMFDRFSARERLFEPSPRGTRLGRLAVELGVLLKGGSEGGFFIMIGRKRA